MTTTYTVTYTTVSGTTRTITVEAVDAIDAKHITEYVEGEVIATARARKSRRYDKRVINRGSPDPR